MLVRIGPQNPLLVLKDDIIRAVLRLRQQKPRPRVTAVWHDKDPSLLKEHRPKICSSSPAMLTSPFECNILEQ